MPRIELTTERSWVTAGAHTLPGSLRCGHGALQARDEGGAGVQVLTDRVLAVNRGQLGRRASHLSLPGGAAAARHRGRVPEVVGGTLSLLVK